jgi:hypothetical protein
MFRSAVSVCRLPGLRQLCLIVAVLACVGLSGCKSFYHDDYWDYDRSAQSGLSGWGKTQRWSEDRGDFFATTNKGMDIRDNAGYK